MKILIIDNVINYKNKDKLKLTWKRWYLVIDWWLTVRTLDIMSVKIIAKYINKIQIDKQYRTKVS